jgi:predicted transcriptional regulator
MVLEKVLFCSNILAMRTAADILASKPPVFNVIEADAKVLEALHLMSTINLSYLVVMQEGRFAGIFSEREYSRNVLLKGLSSSTATVKEVMNTGNPIISPAVTVEKCMQLLNSHKTRYLVVFVHDVFRGIVTINDVLREAINNKEFVFDHVTVQQFTDLQDKIF